VEREATAILRSASDRTTTGSMSGFILASLSFLEKYQNRFPDTYARAQVVCDKARCLEPDPADLTLGMDHFRGMQGAATSIDYLMRGIAAGGALR